MFTQIETPTPTPQTISRRSKESYRRGVVGGRESGRDSSVLTSEDIDLSKVGVGVIIDCQSEKGEKTSFTFLGPWDANPDKNILSFQPKLAKAMTGLKVGDLFEMQGKKFKITAIRSAL